MPRKPGSETSLHIRAHPFTAEPEQAAEFCMERWRAAAQAGMQLGIDFSCIEADDFPHWLRRFEHACEQAGRLPATGLLVSVTARHAGALPLIGMRSSAALSHPRVAIRYTEEDTQDKGRQEVWRACVAASCADADVLLVPSFSGRLLSGMHSRERGSCVLPDSLLETPADTAWLMVDIDATRLGPPASMRRQLARVLRFADNLIDEIAWHRPALQVDALLNRRIGLHLGRLGDMLVSNAVDPGEGNSFNQFRRWLNFARDCVLHESLLLARTRGPFPELGASQLIAELTPRYGSAVAQQLVRNRFLRHRHLLSLSPCALFPSGFAAGNGETWLKLLPAISCADALSMYGPDPRKRLYMSAWGRLLQLCAALHEPRNR
jgi:hypothetical protein